MEIYIYDKASLARPASQLQRGTSALRLPCPALPYLALPCLACLPGPFKMRRSHCLPKGFVGKNSFFFFFSHLFFLSLLFYYFFSLLFLTYEIYCARAFDMKPLGRRSLLIGHVEARPNPFHVFHMLPRIRLFVVEQRRFVCLVSI